MDVIDVSKLKRDPSVIKSYFKVTNDITIVNSNIRVVFPERFVTKELASMGATVRLPAIYAIIDEDDNYAITLSPIIQELSPYVINNISVGDVVYKELLFNKGDVFIINNNLIMQDNFMYDLFDEFYIKGNIPWYLNYDDVSNIFLETKKYANSNIGNNPLTFEILTAITTRDINNKTVFYRTALNNKNKTYPYYIGLNNIQYSFDNTGAKIIGGYMGAGLTNAIISPETKTSRVSEVLRK